MKKLHQHKQHVSSVKTDRQFQLMLYIYMPQQNKQNKISNKLNTICFNEFPEDVRINHKELDNI